MADDLIPPVIVKILADAGEFTRRLSESGAQLRGFQAKAEETGLRVREAALQSATAADGMVAAQNRALAASGRVAEAQAAVARETAAAAVAADGDTVASDRLATAQSALAVAAREAALAERGVERASIDQARAMGAAARATQEHSAKLGGASSFARFGQKAFAGLAGAVAITGYEGIKMAGNFQQATNVLVTAASLPAKQLGEAQAGIKKIAIETGTDWQKVAEAFYTTTKAGYSAADSTKIVRAAAQAAREENANLADVTNGVTSAMQDYGVKAGGVVPLVNAMKTASGRTKDTFEEFTKSLHSFLPVGSSMHLSFQELNGALATFTQHGESAQLAGQHLGRFVQDLSAPSGKAAKAMEQLGLSSVDLRQHLGERGLTGTLGVVVNAIGKHMGPAGLVLVDSFKKSAAASADLGAMFQKLPPNVQALAQKFDSGKISLKDFHGELKHLPTTQANLLGQYASLSARANGFNDALRNGTPAANTFSGELRAVLGTTTSMNSALMLSGSSSTFFHDTVKLVGKSAADTSKTVEGWSTTQKNFNTQMGRAKQGAEFFAMSLGNKLMPVVTHAIDFASRHKRAMEALAGVFTGVVAAGIAAYTAHLAVAGVKSVKEFASMVKSGGTWAAEHAGAFKKGAQALSDFGGKIADTGASVYTKFTNMASDAARWSRDMIAKAAKAGTAYAKDLVKSIADGAKSAASTFADMVKNAGSWAKDMASKAADAAAAYAKAFAKAMADAAKAAAAAFVDMARKAWTWAGEMLAAGAEALLPFAPIILAAAAVALAAYELHKHWREVWAGIKAATEAAWQAIKRYVNDIKRDFENAFTVIKDVVRVFVDVFTGQWGKLWADAKRLVSDGFTLIKGVFRTFMDSAPGLLLQAGKDIVMGLVHGIESMAGAAGGAILGVGKGLVQAFTGHMIIKSPSQRFHEYGRNIVQGLANGITAHGRHAVDAARRVAQEVAQVAAAAHVSTAEAAKHIAGAVGPVQKALDAIGKAHQAAARHAALEHERAAKRAHAAWAHAHTAILKLAREKLLEQAADLHKALEAQQQDLQGMLDERRQMAADLAKGIVGSSGQIVDAFRQQADGAKAAAQAHESAMRDVLSAQQALTDAQTAAAQATAQGTEATAGIIRAQADLTAAQTAAQKATDAFAQAQKAAQDPVGSLMDTLNAQLDQTRAFGAQLTALTAAGASKDLLQQVAQAGADTGGALAAALLVKGPDAVKNISTVMQNIQQAGQTAADAVAGSFYDKGIASVQAVIDGMAAREAALKAQVDRINALIAQVAGSTAALADAQKAQDAAADATVAQAVAVTAAVAQAGPSLAGSAFAPGGFAFVPPAPSVVIPAAGRSSAGDRATHRGVHVHPGAVVVHVHGPVNHDAVDHVTRGVHDALGRLGTEILSGRR